MASKRCWAMMVRSAALTSLAVSSMCATGEPLRIRLEMAQLRAEDVIGAKRHRFAPNRGEATGILAGLHDERLHHQRRVVGPGSVREIVDRRRAAAEGDALRVERRGVTGASTSSCHETRVLPGGKSAAGTGVRV